MQSKALLKSVSSVAQDPALSVFFFLFLNRSYWWILRAESFLKPHYEPSDAINDVPNLTFVAEDDNEDVSEWMAGIISCCLKTRQFIRDTWLGTLMWLDFVVRTVCWIKVYINELALSIFPRKLCLK